MSLVLFPGVPGGLEMAVILLIAVLLFGANKIPKLARSTGQAMGEFRRGREEIEQELDEMRDTAEEDLNPDSTTSSTTTDSTTGTTDDTRTTSDTGTETEAEKQN